MFETKSGIIKPIVYVGFLNRNRLLLVNYKNAPNPAKPGWWIPAPALEFGEDPKEKVDMIAADFGLHIDRLALHSIESFVQPGGWHLIWHYVVNTSSEPMAHPGIEEFRWVTQNELSELKDIAHGRWEKNVGMNYLSSNGYEDA